MATESAPPETASATGVPADGKLHSAKSFALLTGLCEGRNGFAVPVVISALSTGHATRHQDPDPARTVREAEALAAMALVGKYLDVVADCGGNDAKNATAYKEDGEPKEPRLVEGEKHLYRLSGDDAKAILRFGHKTSAGDLPAQSGQKPCRKSGRKPGREPCRLKQTATPKDGLSSNFRQKTRRWNELGDFLAAGTGNNHGFVR
jgi:hypothetical protein